MAPNILKLAHSSSRRPMQLGRSHLLRMLDKLDFHEPE
jgi:hypothetical protein